MGESGVPGDNHRLVAGYWKTSSHDIVSENNIRHVFCIFVILKRHVSKQVAPMCQMERESAFCMWSINCSFVLAELFYRIPPEKYMVLLSNYKTTQKEGILNFFLYFSSNFNAFF